MVGFLPHVVPEHLGWNAFHGNPSQAESSIGKLSVLVALQNICWSLYRKGEAVMKSVSMNVPEGPLL